MCRGDDSVKYGVQTSLDASLNAGVEESLVELSVKSEKNKAKPPGVASVTQVEVNDFPEVVSRSVAPTRNFIPAMQALASSSSWNHYLSMPAADVLGDSLVAQWQDFQASLCVWERLHKYSECEETLKGQVSDLSKKVKELNKKTARLTTSEKDARMEILETTKQRGVLARRVEVLTGKVASLEADAEEKVKVYEKNLRETSTYYSWSSRIEAMEEFRAGRHVDWDVERECNEFSVLYPVPPDGVSLIRVPSSSPVLASSGTGVALDGDVVLLDGDVSPSS